MIAASEFRYGGGAGCVGVWEGVDDVDEMNRGEERVSIQLSSLHLKQTGKPSDGDTGTHSVEWEEWEEWDSQQGKNRGCSHSSASHISHSSASGP